MTKLLFPQSMAASWEEGKLVAGHTARERTLEEKIADRR